MRSMWWTAAGAAILAGCAGAAPQEVTAVVPVSPIAITTSSPAPEDPACPADMILIRGGPFEMGSAEGTPDIDEDELPQHTVTVGAFCMARTETTVAAYEQCVQESACKPAPTTSDWNGGDDDRLASAYCNGGKAAMRDHPINCVDWFAATSYCKSRGLRLPTEREWEYAARGPAGRPFPWGSEPPDETRINGAGAEAAATSTSWGGSPNTYPGNDGFPASAPVGSFRQGATPEGLMDMSGNVVEWTSSRYCPYPAAECAEEERVIRGGGWGSAARQQRAVHRGKSEPEKRHESLGFRCAVTP